MATPKIIADFETQLSTALAVGGTSFSISSGVDDDGVSLPTGKYYFTIDNGTSAKEYVVGTLTGTSVTSVSNVTRQGTESSGVVRAHRVGASVIMTDFMTYKNYIDETTVAGAADADANTKGVVEVPTSAEIDADTATGSTGASLAVSPDQLVLSKYGTRLPTANEKAALAGAGAAPSASNKFLTEDDINTTFFPTPQVVVFTSSGTWTKDAGLKYIIVEGVGGGGGNDTDGEDGGGGGGYFRKLILAAALGATETVTIGAGGNAAGTPTNGGNTSFGAHAAGNGGVAGGAGGTATGGDINITGQDSESGSSGTGGNYALGGSTPLGLGGTGNGGGTGYGSGGGSGQNGQPGIVIVTEYYS